MYPFNSTPGTRPVVPTFGALGLAGFDDRDSQFLIGFDLASQIPAGSYRVLAARLTIAVAEPDTFAYDPSADPLASYFDPADPQYQPDSDPGRPIELFPVGYRNGYTAATFLETSPFGGVPLVPPAEGARNAFAATLGASGDATDASRNVRLREEAMPIAVGQIAGLAPGSSVGADAQVVFDVDLCLPGVRPYFASALSAGIVHLAVSSLHPAQPGGGVPATYPIFYARENAYAQTAGLTPRLDLTIIAADDADLNGDGVLDLFDFLTFQNLFAAGDPIADYTDDCTLDIFDFLAFINVFNKG